MKKCGRINVAGLFCVAIGGLVYCFSASDLRAEPEYKSKSGTIAFSVGSNLPFLKVAGSSSDLSGGGEAAANGDIVVVRNLEFEVDPKSFKTGIELRDQHLYEKVFMAADGSIPRIVLRAERFEATPNGKPAAWEGNLNAQLTIRGVTKPVSFHASLEKKGNGAVVTAQGTLKTSSFGVKKIAYSGATVDDEVTVTVSGLRVEP
jgi:polyisoprenoid-binding protein YceI